MTRSADEFMGSCDCDGRCTATLCSCQDDAEIQDDDEISKSFAYDANVHRDFRGMKISD